MLNHVSWRNFVSYQPGDTLRPFLPQLQTTYVKCLSDPPNSQDLSHLDGGTGFLALKEMTLEWFCIEVGEISSPKSQISQGSE